MLRLDNLKYFGILMLSDIFTKFFLKVIWKIKTENYCKNHAAKAQKNSDLVKYSHTMVKVTGYRPTLIHTHNVQTHTCINVAESFLMSWQYWSKTNKRKRSDLPDLRKSFKNDTVNGFPYISYWFIRLMDDYLFG